MSTLLINKKFENIKIPNISSSFDHKLKEIFSEATKNAPVVLNEYENIKNNVFLKERFFDFIYKTEDESLLINNGYELCNLENMHSGKYNNCSLAEVKQIKDYVLKSNIWSYNSGNYLLELSSGQLNIYQNNSGYSNNKDNKIFCLDIVNGELKDFGIYKDYIYFLYMKDSDYYIVKTHIGFNFITQKSKGEYVLDFDNIESFYDLKVKNLSGNISGLIFDALGSVYISAAGKLYILELTKKYYFYDKGYYYFNEHSDLKIVSESYVTQIEHLYLYELLYLYGLDGFVKDEKKISSNEIEKFKNLFNFKFDNTLNGAINFFDFWDNDKSYKVKVSNKNFTCYGNFIDDFTSGNYEIVLKVVTGTEDNSSFKIDVCINKNGKNIKHYIADTVLSSIGVYRDLYVNNLRFFFKNYKYSKDQTFKLNITVFENDYIVKAEENNLSANQEIKYDIKDLDHIINNQTFQSTDRNVKGDFGFKIIDNNLVFKNVNVNGKNFIEGVSAQSEFKIPLIINNKPSEFFKKIKNIDYYISPSVYFSFTTSDIKTFVTNNEKIVLSNDIKIKYEKLSGSKNLFKIIDVDSEKPLSFLTYKIDGSDVYKIVDSNVTFDINFNYNFVLTSLFDLNKNNSLGIASLPTLSNSVKVLKNTYRNLKINSELKDIVAIKNTGINLITDKFVNEPLFYKFIINNYTRGSTIILRTSSGEEVTNFLVENENGKTYCYFAPLKTNSYEYAFTSSDIEVPRFTPINTIVFAQSGKYTADEEYIYYSKSNSKYNVFCADEIESFNYTKVYEIVIPNLSEGEIDKYFVSNQDEKFKNYFISDSKIYIYDPDDKMEEVIKSDILFLNILPADKYLLNKVISNVGILKAEFESNDLSILRLKAYYEYCLANSFLPSYIGYALYVYDIDDSLFISFSVKIAPADYVYKKPVCYIESGDQTFLWNESSVQNVVNDGSSYFKSINTTINSPEVYEDQKRYILNNEKDLNVIYADFEVGNTYYKNGKRFEKASDGNLEFNPNASDLFYENFNNSDMPISKAKVYRVKYLGSDKESLKFYKENFKAVSMLI